MKKKLILALVIVICIVSAVIWRMQYQKINKEYPQAVVHEVRANQPLKINQDTMTATAGKLTLCDRETFQKAYNCDKTFMKQFELNVESDVTFAIVPIEVKNISDQEQNLDPTGIVMGSEVCSNGLDYSLYTLLNKNLDSLNFKPGETKTIILPYVFVNQYFTGKLDKSTKLDGITFELTFSLYPEKRVVCFTNSEIEKYYLE